MIRIKTVRLSSNRLLNTLHPPYKTRQTIYNTLLECVRPIQREQTYTNIDAKKDEDSLPSFAKKASWITKYVMLDIKVMDNKTHYVRIQKSNIASNKDLLIMQ